MNASAVNNYFIPLLMGCNNRTGHRHRYLIRSTRSDNALRYIIKNIIAGSYLINQAEILKYCSRSIATEIIRSDIP